jgi:hypothetical protein
MIRTPAELAVQHRNAWIALTIAFGLHVADEMTGGSLDMYNRVATALHARFEWLVLPSLGFAPRMAILACGVLVLLALTPAVWRGARLLVLLSLPLGVLMVMDGLYHIVLAVAHHGSVPGLRTAPLIVLAALWLLVAAHRRWHARAVTS